MEPDDPRSFSEERTSHSGKPEDSLPGAAPGSTTETAPRTAPEGPRRATPGAFGDPGAGTVSGAGERRELDPEPKERSEAEVAEDLADLIRALERPEAELAKAATDLERASGSDPRVASVVARMRGSVARISELRGLIDRLMASVR